MLVGAGDIATCSGTGDEATANLLDGIAGTVFTVGDNAYNDGSAAQFANCYDPSWGRHKGRTKPAAGNHEYQTANASGYFGYFGAAAGDPAKGYYSYDLGAWHVIVLGGAGHRRRRDRSHPRHPHLDDRHPPRLSPDADTRVEQSRPKKNFANAGAGPGRGRQTRRHPRHPHLDGEHGRRRVDLYLLARRRRPGG